MKCLTCNQPTKQFVSSGRFAKFCSWTCRQRGQHVSNVLRPRVSALTCETCGNSFRSKNYSKNQRFCSIKCRGNGKAAFVGPRKRRHRMNRRGSRMVSGVCGTCQAPFKKKVTWGRSKDKKNDVFCSKRCQFAYVTARSMALHMSPGAVAERQRRKIEKEIITKVQQRKNELALANKRFVSFCLSRRNFGACRRCHVRFFREEKNQRFCTDLCQQASRLDAKRRYRRIRKAIDRARKRRVPFQRVDPLKVFERDHWRCQICNVETPQSLRGTYEDDAPELDHIVPLSLGGHHTYANTQCACRKCNGLKGNSVYIGGGNYQKINDLGVDREPTNWQVFSPAEIPAADQFLRNNPTIRNGGATIECTTRGANRDVSTGSSHESRTRLRDARPCSPLHGSRAPAARPRASARRLRTQVRPQYEGPQGQANPGRGVPRPGAARANPSPPSVPPMEGGAAGTQARQPGVAAR